MITPNATQKIYVDEHGEGTVTCPNCEKSKRVNFVKFKSAREPLKVKCICGSLFKIIVELRNYYRKSTQLPGNYTTPGSNKSGSIIVEDVSLSGIGFRTRLKHNLQIGEVIDLRFELDNSVRSEIVKRAVVKRLHDQFVGAEFCDLRAFDTELGYYLMPG
jgi:hypothetical protein